MTENKNQKYARFFDTEHIKKEVKNKSVKAGVANLISQVVSLIITLGRAAILARLLSPDDYGVFTIAVVVISFALIFKDLGLSTATIREKEINHAQVSNLFWINTVIGFISMGGVIAISPGLVWFYKDSRLYPIAFVLSIAFLFGGMSVQHQALLRRQMQFKKIAVVTILADTASSLIGIIVAWYHYEYWALIWMNVTRSFFLMNGFFMATRWVPSLPSKRAGTKKMLKIGVDVAGLNAFSTLTQNIDKILAGRIANTSLLGLYTKGNQVPNLLSGKFRMAFFSIALPALSSLQNEKRRFAQYYYDFLSLIGWVTIPLAVSFFVFADEIIQLYFGPKWVGAIPFMRIFAVHSLFMPIITILDQIPLALGYSRRYLAAGIVRSIGSIISVCLGGYFYGISGIAIGVGLANIVTFFPFAFLCMKDSPVNLCGYFQTLSIPFAVSIGSGVVFTLVPKTGVVQNVLLMGGYFIAVLSLLLVFDFLKIGHKTGIFDYLKKREVDKQII